MVYTFDVPLKVLERTRKKDGKEFWFSLNLNAYTQIAVQTFRRNAVKQKYQGEIAQVLSLIPRLTASKIELTYEIWMPTKRRVDLMNVGSIVDKFVSDALVHAGVIMDDNIDVIPEVHFKYAGVDKERPRADVTITELETGL